MRDTATFTMSVEDVLDIDPTLTTEEAREILGLLEKNEAPMSAIRECLWTLVNDYADERRKPAKPQK